MMIRGEQLRGTRTATIKAPWDGAEVGIHPLGSAEDMDAAVEANVEAADGCRHLPAYERASCLRRIADGLQSHMGELDALLAREAGKPITQARLELDRAIFVFRDAAEEATRIGGDLMPLDVMAAGKARIGLTRRFPLSPIAAITPDRKSVV